MELVKEINFKKRNWRRDIGVIAVSLGVVLVCADVWFQEFLALTWRHLLITAVVVFPLHELAHGALLKLWTGKVKFGAGITKFGPVFYATSLGSFLPRNKMLIIALAPQVLTLLYFGLSYLPLIEQVHVGLILAGVLNLGGGVGDFYVVVQMLKHSKELQVEDSPTGMKFYMPEKGVISESTESVA